MDINRMMENMMRARTAGPANLRRILDDLRENNLLPQLEEHYLIPPVGVNPSWVWELRRPLEAHPELRSISVIWTPDGDCLEFALRGADGLIYISELGMDDIWRTDGASGLARCLLNIANGQSIHEPDEESESEDEDEPVPEPVPEPDEEEESDANIEWYD